MVLIRAGKDGLQVGVPADPSQCSPGPAGLRTITALGRPIRYSEGRQRRDRRRGDACAGCQGWWRGLAHVGVSPTFGRCCWAVELGAACLESPGLLQGSGGDSEAERPARCAPAER